MSTVDQSLRDAIARAGERSKRLEELDNKITSIIVDLEQRLRAVVSVRIDAEMVGGGRLVFGKHNGSWAFIVEGRGANKGLLTSASREVRSRVLTDGTMLRLITEAPAQLDEQIRQRRLALTAADDVVALLGRTEP